MLIPIISSSSTGKHTCYINPEEVVMIGFDGKVPYIILKNRDRVINLESTIDIEMLAKTINGEYIET